MSAPRAEPLRTSGIASLPVPVFMRCAPGTQRPFTHFKMSTRIGYIVPLPLGLMRLTFSHCSLPHALQPAERPSPFTQMALRLFQKIPWPGRLRGPLLATMLSLSLPDVWPSMLGPLRLSSQPPFVFALRASFLGGKLLPALNCVQPCRPSAWPDSRNVAVALS